MEIRTLPSQAADIRSSSRYGLSNPLGFKYHIVIEPLGYTIVNNKLNTTETTTLLKQIQRLQQSKVVEIEAQYIPLSQIYVIAKSKFHWNAIEIQRLEKISVNITSHTSTEPRKNHHPYYSQVGRHNYPILSILSSVAIKTFMPCATILT